MAELVDALDLGSCAARRGGSTPSTRTFFSLSTVPLFIFILTTPQIRGYTYALICGSFACDLSYICLNYK